MTTLRYALRTTHTPYRPPPPPLIYSASPTQPPTYPTQVSSPLRFPNNFAHWLAFDCLLPFGMCMCFCVCVCGKKPPIVFLCPLFTSSVPRHNNASVLACSRGCDKCAIRDKCQRFPLLPFVTICPRSPLFSHFIFCLALYQVIS